MSRYLLTASLFGVIPGPKVGQKEALTRSQDAYVSYQHYLRRSDANRSFEGLTGANSNLLHFQLVANDFLCGTVVG